MLDQKKKLKMKSTIMGQKKKMQNPMNIKNNIPLKRNNPNLNNLEIPKVQEVADSMNRYLEPTHSKALLRK